MESLTARSGTRYTRNPAPSRMDNLSAGYKVVPCTSRMTTASRQHSTKPPTPDFLTIVYSADDTTTSRRSERLTINKQSARNGIPDSSGSLTVRSIRNTLLTTNRVGYSIIKSKATNNDDDPRRISF
uniref:(northern house mosquito) hypothetical protein n=1 Tax=Culex pipiens TaxID=7175 RepID=A0A8D8D442_CULPI